MIIEVRVNVVGEFITITLEIRKQELKLDRKTYDFDGLDPFSKDKN